MSNTVHDMGGMHGFGPVELEPNETCLPRRLGGPRARAAAGAGSGGAMVDRRRPRLARKHQTGDLSRQHLLPALVSRDGEARPRLRAGRHRRDGRRPFAARGEKTAAPADHGRYPQAADPRQFRACARRAGEVPAGRPGAHQRDEPGDAYAPAALCARQGRRRRGDPRMPRLPRHRRARRPQRAAAMALHGGVHRQGAVGPRRRPLEDHGSLSRRSSPDLEPA